MKQGMGNMVAVAAVALRGGIAEGIYGFAPNGGAGAKGVNHLNAVILTVGDINVIGAIHRHRAG